MTDVTNARIGEVMPGKPLSREETKAITRRRLIEAALKLADAGGGRSFTASEVAREAGVAQPTFYVHFRDRDDLLKALGESQIDELRQELARARAAIDLEAMAGGHPDEALREAFRLSVTAMLEHPMLFRVYVRERTHSDSPLARHCRGIADALREDLVTDLRTLDEHLSRDRSDAERTMLADAIGAFTEALGLGHLDGRYDDLEEIIDVLARFTRSALA